MEGSISNSRGSEEEENTDDEGEGAQRQIPLHMGLSEVKIKPGLHRASICLAYPEHTPRLWSTH